MKVYGPEEIRNLAVVGHGGCGKTTLVSSLLHSSEAVNRFGRVEEKNTVTDFDPDEMERQISMQLAACHLEWKKNKVNLLDTPGYSAFLFDARMALQVVESALLTICAVNGPELGSTKTWTWAEELDLPRFLVISRLDRERADFDRSLEQIQETLARECVALQLPIGKEGDFEGVVDIVGGKAWLYKDDASGTFEKKDIPEEIADKVAEARQALVEMVAEMDDELMEKYLEAGELTEEEFITGLRRAVRQRKIYPVFAAAGGKNIGAHPLMDALVDLAPSPAKAEPRTARKAGGDDEVTLAADPSGDTGAFVFKTVADPFAGRISMFRVFSGTVASDAPLYNSTQEVEERLGPVFAFQGKEHIQIPEAQAGDIVGVAKLKQTVTNDTLCTKGTPLVLPAVPAPDPAIAFAIEPKAKGDEDKISSALSRLLEEDLSLKAERDAQTGQLLLSGTGELHVRSVVDKMKKRFNVEVDLKAPKVPYRETIQKKAQASYRHKKQTGGAGQFAEVHLRVEPNERGGGFEYSSEVFGGAISQQFIPSIEKGIKAVLHGGAIAGYPVVDIKAIVYDGKEHPVDSKDVAFQTAGRNAFKAAVQQAKPVILEPVMQVEIICPEDSMGDVMGDLNQRRGRVQGMDAGPAGMQVIRCQVPLAEMLTYAPSLNSITGGQGEFHMELDHYAQVPSNIQQKLVEAHQAPEEAEED